jgi:hypothetical protein
MDVLENRIMMTFHEKFSQYDLGEGHPFRGDRFANAIQFFESQGLFNIPEIVLDQSWELSKFWFVFGFSLPLG